MPKRKKAKGKKVALAHTVVKKQKAKKVVNPLFEERPRTFSIGQDIQSQRDLTCFLKCSATSGCSSKNPSSISSSKHLLPFTQALDRQATTQLLKRVHK
jgi:large subunit ribosomal protein L7Ae